MKKSIITLSLCTLCMNAFSQGGITPDIMKKISEHNKMTVSEKALQNALARNDINSLAVSQNNQGDMDTYFTYSVPSNGITDQMSSGRCWLFTGLNVIRSKAMIEKGIDVWFALEAYELSTIRHFDYVVLITGDADHEMLIRKLKALKIYTILLSWDVARGETSTSRFLREEACTHIELSKEVALNPALLGQLCRPVRTE